MQAGSNIFVIGLGNILAGDDGVGIEVLNRLQAGVDLPPGVELIEAGIPGLSLVEMMQGAGQVILVDSFLAQGSPGTVCRLAEDELPPPGYATGQSHGIGLREALAFARGVMPEQFPREVVVIGISIQRPRRWVHGLSPPVQSAVEIAAQMVLTELIRMRGGG